MYNLSPLPTQSSPYYLPLSYLIPFPIELSHFPFHTLSKIENLLLVYRILLKDESDCPVLIIVYFGSMDCILFVRPFGKT